jgi:hypothetical protein
MWSNWRDCRSEITVIQGSELRAVAVTGSACVERGALVSVGRWALATRRTVWIEGIPAGTGAWNGRKQVLGRAVGLQGAEGAEARGTTRSGWLTQGEIRYDLTMKTFRQRVSLSHPPSRTEAMRIYGRIGASSNLLLLTYAFGQVIL